MLFHDFVGVNHGVAGAVAPEIGADALVGEFLENGVDFDHVQRGDIPRQLVAVFQQIGIGGDPVNHVAVVRFFQRDFAYGINAVGHASGLGAGFGGHVRHENRMADAALRHDLPAQRLPVVAVAGGRNFIHGFLVGINRQPAFGPAGFVHPGRIAFFAGQLQAGLERKVIVPLGQPVAVIAPRLRGVFQVFARQLGGHAHHAHAGAAARLGRHCHMRKGVVGHVNAFVDHFQRVIGGGGILLVAVNIADNQCGERADGDFAGFGFVFVRIKVGHAPVFFGGQRDFIAEVAAVNGVFERRVAVGFVDPQFIMRAAFISLLAGEHDEITGADGFFGKIGIFLVGFIKRFEMVLVARKHGVPQIRRRIFGKEKNLFIARRFFGEKAVVHDAEMQLPDFLVFGGHGVLQQGDGGVFRVKRRVVAGAGAAAPGLLVGFGGKGQRAVIRQFALMRNDAAAHRIAQRARGNHAADAGAHARHFIRNMVANGQRMQAVARLVNAAGSVAIEPRAQVDVIGAGGVDAVV